MASLQRKIGFYHDNKKMFLISLVFRFFSLADGLYHSTSLDGQCLETKISQQYLDHT